MPSQRDQQWADNERIKLPRYVTSGYVVDEHGNRWLEQSGTSNRVKSLEQHDREIIDRAHHLLSNSDQVPRPRHHQQRLDVVDHVEVKTAMKMRESGTSSLDLVLNNTMCKSTPGRVSCRRAVRAILRRGDTLRVWEPGRTEPTTIRGVGPE